MIDTLISGRVRGAPTFRTASNGTPFASFRLAAADRNGVSVLCSCITFSATAYAAVKALEDGDSVAVSGEAELKAWSGRDGAQSLGLDVLVHGVLTPYHLGRKRKGAGSDSVGGDDHG